jgi:hypothetical protein
MIANVINFDEAQARKILGEAIQPDGTLHEPTLLLRWDHKDSDIVCLEGDFTVDELEAIVYWVRSHIATESATEEVTKS